MKEPSPRTDHNEVVAAWCRSDLLRAVLPADREIVGASMTVRSLIIELVSTNDTPDELYDACAVLGRLVAQRGGSPTLASVTVDNAAAAIGIPDAPWVVAARASLAEGFASALIETARRDAMAGWEFPNCAVPLGEAALAIAAGHPSDDEEVLAAWAARTAKAAALRGVRRAVVSGGERACEALVEALYLIGIEVQKAARPRQP
jgi:hypothetical protein